VRSLVAVAAGAAVAAGLFQVGAIVALVQVFGLPLGASRGPPSIGYYVLTLGFAVVAAALGGYVSGRLARPHSRGAVVALALLAAVGALWGFSRPASQWPAWYPATLALVGAAGTLLGGRLGARRAA
jgi:hypothetical protein